MLDLRQVFFNIGVMLTILSVAMLIPALLDFADGHPDWQVFLTSAGLTLFISVSMMLATGRAARATIRLRETFLMTTLSWLLMAGFAALPFAFAGIGLTYIEGYFEAMSGLTTTGATVIVGLEKLPRGLLLWRAMLHFLGGVGIIVIGLAILPFLQVGGMQLFRAESSDKSEKVLPRAAQLATATTSIYAGLGAICAFCYWLAGMNAFDAICHGMSTIATGGFGNYDASIGYFKNSTIEWIAALFMFLGGVSFSVYILALRGRIEALWQDAQVLWYAGIVIAAALSLTTWLLLTSDQAFHAAFRNAVFSVVSILTTTGFVTEDYSTWGGFPVLLFFMLLFVGGCTGSTAGGVKVFRFAVLFAAMRRQVFQLTHPHGVYSATYNQVALPSSVISSVLGFMFLYGVTVFTVAVGLAFMGCDFVTALSGAATAVGNVGPGLGPEIGPAGNFAGLTQGSKGLLSLAMLLGRLELLTVLVIFTAEFWRA